MSKSGLSCHSGPRSAGPCRPSPRARSARHRPAERALPDRRAPRSTGRSASCMIFAGSANMSIARPRPGLLRRGLGVGRGLHRLAHLGRDAPSSFAGRGPSPRSSAACPPGSASAAPARRGSGVLRVRVGHVRPRSCPLFRAGAQGGSPPSVAKIQRPMITSDSCTFRGVAHDEHFTASTSLWPG